ncbi:TetR/AcrR family transcriptional regulator [Kocuria sp. cx-116]|uniref:TetR/AcrR family transcriptional regulator n=1 Tax=Kocuria sp. cx-116 TaxID=2771378 RepID=UPI00168660FD|nr:TetR/AcrR family transcriptional regulator [Kocuria sp. cx-116]MBD2763208.1 TetR/AcrR family transcriptional regulator [Kocuria sp. cx-116]
MNIGCQGEAPKDKRGALKWHNRRAIVMAAGELTDRHGIQGFTVDDLAAKAGVSRRTIFNHFSSAEDAGYEYLSELVTRLIRAVLAELPDASERGEQTLGSVYQDLCTAMRSHSLVEALRPLLLQVTEVKESPTAALWGFRVTSAATERLENVLCERLPDHDRLELQLVATSIINSMSVCMDAWLLRTGGELNDESRRIWDELMSDALLVLGRGFTT